MVRTNHLLSPSWSRVFFASLLALVGFCLPQELPLEWYPLDQPGNNINYLEITCAADVSGEVRVFYDIGRGPHHSSDSIKWPISPSTKTYTYAFPLPDAPISALHLVSLGSGAALTIRQMRIIDRTGTEMLRFTRSMFEPAGQIKSIVPLSDGWKIISEKDATAPSVHILLPSPILATGTGHRNFLRCAYSSGYLALMLWILLLAVLFTFHRPRDWRETFLNLGFMAVLALLFSAVGNRGLIRNSIRFARFIPPAIEPGRRLEIDLHIDQPLAAQLFWDTGQGMREVESIRQKYENHTGLQTISMPLPSVRFTGLRFDPLDGDATVVIRGIRVVDTGNRTLALVPLRELQPNFQIAQCEIKDDTLTVVPIQGAKDPILSFTPKAVALIDETLKSAH